MVSITSKMRNRAQFCASPFRSCDEGSLNATLVRGNVILCFQTRGQRSPIVAARTVSRAHGAGLIFAQFLTKDIAPVFDLPCIQLDFETGTSILTYMEHTRYFLIIIQSYLIVVAINHHTTENLMNSSLAAYTTETHLLNLVMQRRLLGLFFPLKWLTSHPEDQVHCLLMF